MNLNQLVGQMLLWSVVPAMILIQIGAEIPDDDRIHIGDMTCAFYEQPLNHFHVPREKSPSYQQRYCVYDNYVKDPSKAPIFFYTGNESPLEQYINNTGLMWELAPEFGAQVIFMEHRYEGKSLPSPSLPNCMSYSSSKQAIEDYARFLEFWLLNSTKLANGGVDNGSINRRPIIAFGGSYGGMLASWFRMKYPQLVTGAIAASAPIWALPRTNANLIDGAFQVVKRGLQMPYPPTERHSRTPNHCVTNLRSSWPLLQFLAEANAADALRIQTQRRTTAKSPGLAKLTEWFRLCRPLEKIEDLVAWASTPWFDMAEGSFPYDSSYIPFSLIPSNGTILKLPPWPLQAACWNASQLHRDWGVRVAGNETDLRYTVTYGDSGLTLEVDWDAARPATATPDLDRVLASPQIEGLLTGVRDAVAVWYNISHREPCFHLTPANNNYWKNGRAGRKAPGDRNATTSCQERMEGGSWPALFCNEEMNMMITEAPGMGRDPFWPPNYARGTQNHADVARQDAARSVLPVPESCLDPNGTFGYSQKPVDPWSTRLDMYYGGRSISAFSNIVFSNGLLDPWMAGGVHNLSVGELNPTDPFEIPSYSGPMVIPIGSESQNMISLIIELGGHHTDLMYSSKKDPYCVVKAREVEKSYIAKWIAG